MSSARRAKSGVVTLPSFGILGANPSGTNKQSRVMLLSDKEVDDSHFLSPTINTEYSISRPGQGQFTVFAVSDITQSANFILVFGSKKLMAIQSQISNLEIFQLSYDFDNDTVTLTRVKEQISQIKVFEFTIDRNRDNSKLINNLLAEINKHRNAAINAVTTNTTACLAFNKPKSRL